MPNIAAVLKNEISRISRKEVRKEVQPLRKAASAYRREIAALKRAIAALERRAKGVARIASRSPDRESGEPTGKPVRFVAKGLRSLRARLDLSAPELAQLLSVSTQSIYNWEHKKASPRKEQLAAIVALRALGKKKVRQKLESMTQKRTSNQKPAKQRRT
jgi:DNA-binding transcriptional regulator YiaG